MTITQIVPPNYPSKARPLIASERTTCREIAESIATAFLWDETAEGREFWASVQQRLLALADGEELR